MDQRTVDLGGRRVVATYSSYADAYRAVAYLAYQKFPVERVAILVEGIRMATRRTGGRGYGRAAVQGAFAGGLVGLIFGFIFGLLNWIDPLISGLALALNGLVFGAIVGEIVGLIAQAVSNGRRADSLIRDLDAERFNVLVDSGVADEAAGILLGYSAERREPPTGGRGAAPAAG